LNIASKCARYLGLVDAGAFVDRRSPDPQLFAARRECPQPNCSIPPPEWFLPHITVHLESLLDIPEPEVSGYDYALADQHYHLILWIEKSTMDDVLLPVCERFGIDLIIGTDFSSVSSVINMLQRVQGKPVRVFYTSDFDPAGQCMPVGVARQAEFWREQYAPEAEIKLNPVALTREQVIHYRLPRIPIKGSDPRKQAFEDRHGEGAVELDALEALHPGELARLVEVAIRPYFDSVLEARLEEAESAAEEEAQLVWNEETTDVGAELAVIEAEAAAISRKLKPRAEKLAREFNLAMVPLRRRLDTATPGRPRKGAKIWKSSCRSAPRRGSRRWTNQLVVRLESRLPRPDPGVHRA
jgi:hypothetical protein